MAAVANHRNRAFGDLINLLYNAFIVNRALLCIQDVVQFIRTLVQEVIQFINRAACYSGGTPSQVPWRLLKSTSWTHIIYSEFT